jgi:hypothetical protein
MLSQRERRREGASNPFSRREKVAGASRPDEGRRRDSANYHLGLALDLRNPDRQTFGRRLRRQAAGVAI